MNTILNLFLRFVKLEIPGIRKAEPILAGYFLHISAPGSLKPSNHSALSFSCLNQTFSGMRRRIKSPACAPSGKGSSTRCLGCGAQSIS